jgi:hypothetical protein
VVAWFGVAWFGVAWFGVAWRDVQRPEDVTGGATRGGVRLGVKDAGGEVARGGAGRVADVDFSKAEVGDAKDVPVVEGTDIGLDFFRLSAKILLRADKLN